MYSKSKLNGAVNLEAYILRVYGRVQRVGFRRYILDSAQDLGLKGYAKNVPDGSVEIFVQGEKEQLSKFLGMVKQSPPPATIREVKEEETTIDPEIREFKIIYGELSDELQEEFGAVQTTFVEYWKEFGDYRREFGDSRREFRDYRQKFSDFAGKTDENFKLISDKYGEISEKLTVILETLINESRETREMLNETMKTLKEALERLTK